MAYLFPNPRHFPNIWQCGRWLEHSPIRQNIKPEGQGFSLKTTPFILFPSLAIFTTILAFNFLGDGLRDALDLRLKAEKGPVK